MRVGCSSSRLLSLLLAAIAVGHLSGFAQKADLSRFPDWKPRNMGPAGMSGRKAGFKAKATINRFDYNLKWNRATEAGGLVVGENVDVVLNIQLNEVK